MQLSSETIWMPLSRIAPIRFSVSSALFEVVITGQNCPVETMAITSTR